MNPSEGWPYLSASGPHATGGFSPRCHIRTLERIKDELLPILERSNTVGYEESDPDVHSVCELAENVRDAVMEYQVSRSFLVTLKIHG